ncbi:MAG TPA: cytochrome c oxidase subunit 3 [Solirubrobacterales bacterium]|nr:cytochrome c oxidase subunit 3 [Solirubrobacterales bacterium]
MESASVPLPHGAGGHAAADAHHHGPPEAHQSSRIDKQTLGIFLFIVSEVMLFGSFFASYFFLRVVVNPVAWPAKPFELPVTIALMNTCILISSSFTIHYALEAIRKGNKQGMKLGLVVTWLLGLTFLFVQINEYVHLGFSARTESFGTIFYSLTGLHGAHVFIGLTLLTAATIRAFRGHYGKEPEKHMGVEIPGIYWHFVDIMWIVVFLTVYVL